MTKYREASSDYQRSWSLKEGKTKRWLLAWQLLAAFIFGVITAIFFLK